MKKGQTAEYIQWILNFIPVFIVAVFIFIVASQHINKPYDIHEEEVEILIANLLYKCLAEESNPGLIQSKKISEAHLKDCYSKQTMGYKLTFLNKEKKEFASLKNFPNLNQEKALPVCSTIPEFTCATRTLLSAMKTEEKIEPIYIKVEVINRVA